MTPLVNYDIAALLQQLGIGGTQLNSTQRLILISAILLFATLIYLVCHKAIKPVVHKITARTQTNWDDHLLNEKVLNSLCNLIPPIIIYTTLPLAFRDQPVTLDFLLRLCGVYITITTVRLVCNFLTSLHTISTEDERLKGHSLKGVFQMIKLCIICIGTIITVGILIDKDPATLLAGLGASAAILMLVFKDSIIGLVAGVQLSVNDMLRVGDWITIPKYNTDGTVMEITLTTVKVRNWDNTIATIPPYTLVSDSFQNWRGMRESGGRRVKRSLYIDMNTIRFCTEQQLHLFCKEIWMEGLSPSPTDPPVNLYLFRRYVEHYLRHHPQVNARLTLMVRQLQPTPQGLPLEFYFFSKDKDWIPYEHLQASVLEHLMATLPRFGLKVFQSPSGTDLTLLGK